VHMPPGLLLVCARVQLSTNHTAVALLTGCVTITFATGAGGVNWRSKAGTSAANSGEGTS